MYHSSQNVQEGQLARRGAIRTETVLKLVPQIWFLKATLVFPLGTTSHLNRYQQSSILDAAALESTSAADTGCYHPSPEPILPSLYFFASLGLASKSSLCG